MRTGRLRPVRRGVYRIDDAGDLTAGSAHVLRARAATPHVAGDAAFGHVTAALALRLPVWGLPLDRLHLVRERARGGGRVRRGTRVHRAPLPPGDVVEWQGLRLTSPAWTLADLARSVSAERALVTRDAALHERVRRRPPSEPPGPGVTTVDRVAGVLDRFAGRRGVPAARRVLDLADARCESPGESRSRFRMHLAGLPPPATRWVVPDLGFRTDFAWPERGVVGEFDGRVKCGRALKPGQDVGEVLCEEKRREDRIRATGLVVVRWVWSDLTDGTLLARLGAALRHPVASRGAPRDGCHAG
ncbi:MAG: hypothetical protein M3235_06710 [Actinomycetota bacterium]|nr:hypothetical protein [Actinomycetota bacterium]